MEKKKSKHTFTAFSEGVLWATVNIYSGESSVGQPITIKVGDDLVRSACLCDVSLDLYDPW